MRIRIIFTTSVEAGYDLKPEADYPELVDELRRYVDVDTVILLQHFDTAPDSPWTFRETPERAYVLTGAATLSGIADYCLDYSRVASLVACEKWELTSSGDDLSHTLFIAQPD